MATGSADPTRSTPGLRGARPGGLRALERALWIAGALGLGWCLLVVSASRIDQILANRQLDRAIARRSSDRAAAPQPIPSPAVAPDSRPLPGVESFGPPAPPPAPPRAVAQRSRPLPAAALFAPSAALVRGAIIARIEIEKIGLSVVAREGDDARTLRLAVGHIPGTPIPPHEGNAAFAGHRDRQFHRLGRLQPNDAIRLTTEAGEFVYRVEWTAVVDPKASWVLDPTPDATITLVTCFPFGYVGDAPDRFVVRARLAAS